MTKCDEVLGAGLTFNTGGYAANKLCDLHDGHRYIVGDEPDMAGSFECIAKVGASGGTAKSARRPTPRAQPPASRPRQAPVVVGHVTGP